MNRPDWNDYFILLAHVVSIRSIDPSTKHGALLCDPNHKILGMGYNGFPRGCNDAEIPTTRPEKYDWIIHAEINCILNSQIPCDVDKCTLYVTGHPCVNCLKTIAQTGIKHVIYGNVQSNCVPESETAKMKLMSKQTGVVLEPHVGKLIENIDYILQYLKNNIVE